MARSNGPFGPAGARPPARRHPEDPYAAPPTAQPNGQWPSVPPYPDPGHVSQSGQGYHFPPEPEANYGYNQPAPTPFDRYQNGAHQQQYPPQQQWSQQHDPRGYDLGSYMPSTPQPYPPLDPGQFQQGPAQQGLDHGPYAAQRQGYAETDADYEDEEFADGDEPGRGRRWMFIAVAALVGAVGVGGALAYTYKSLFASSPGRVPVVKADPNLKARPGDKMLTRLGEDSAPNTGPNADAQDDRTGDESGGPRRVKTIPINPNAPQMVPTSPPPSPQASPSLPGIMLDNMGPRPQQQPPPAPKVGPQPRVTLGTPPPQQQVQPQVEQPPPAVKKAPAPPPAVAPKAAKHTPPPVANAGSGFVAVLSSQKSRMDALKVFADLQQRYPEPLNGKVPDVQEADLGEKGTWYRVVVGPPGSRDSANAVCNQLKSAGYANCWVNSY